MPLFTARRIFFVNLVLLASCTRPLLVENNGPTAAVEIANSSVGYVQVMTFGDPQTCDDIQLVGYRLTPGQTRQHSLPAGKVITISVGAIGLPAAPGYVAWCSPMFLSTRLLAGGDYRLTFVADASTKTCTVSVVDKLTGQAPPSVRREGTGGAGSGTLTKPASCVPNREIDRL